MSIKMKRVMGGILAVPFSLIMSPFSTGQDVSQIQIKITPLAEGIFMLEGAEGKILEETSPPNRLQFWMPGTPVEWDPTSSQPLSIAT